MIRRESRGFTLLEILISASITLVAVAAAMGVLTTQNRTFTRQNDQGQAVAQSELATDAIERAIRLAGTGIDPQMAFDFDSYRCVLPGGGLNMTESTNCSNGVRDAVDAADELVVSYRDPAYVTNGTPGYTGCPTTWTGFIGRIWGVRSATASSVTLAMKPGDTIYRGQALQIACDDGITYLYATVSSGKTSVAASGSACTDKTLNLYAAQNEPFNRPANLAAACFNSGTARAYAVKRQRFFIHRETTGPIPHGYLMLDQGLDLDDDGQLTDLDLLPIAADIEDLQVAYALDQVGILGLATAPTGWVKSTYVKDSDANGIWGDDPAKGSAEQLSSPLNAGNPATAQFDAANSALGYGTGQKCTNSAATAFYQYPCILGTLPVEDSKSNSIHAYRWISWPGNISSVQVGLVARAPVQQATAEQTNEEQVIPALLNRPAQGPSTYATFYNAMNPSGHKRVTVRTTVRPVNMAIQSLFWN
jgi:type II secretory pathway pseudopilin PulG